MKVCKCGEEGEDLIFDHYTFRIGNYRQKWELGSIPSCTDWSPNGLDFYANCLIQVAERLKALNNE